jgi:hypothetical protein
VSRETDIKGGSSVDWGRGEARWLCTKNLGWSDWSPITTSGVQLRAVEFMEFSGVLVARPKLQSRGGISCQCSSATDGDCGFWGDLVKIFAGRSLGSVSNDIRHRCLQETMHTYIQIMRKWRLPSWPPAVSSMWGLNIHLATQSLVFCVY